MVRALVIMLSTDQQGRKVGDLMKVVLPRDNEKLGDLFIGERETHPIHNAHYQHQNLHFIVNEEMKIGDWNITGNIERHNYAIRRITDARDVEHFNQMRLIMSSDKIPRQVISQKIIASTDRSLGLPNIPHSFIGDYAKNCGAIGEVLLSTCCLLGDECPSKGAYDKQHLCEIGLVLNKNNEVTIIL